MNILFVSAILPYPLFSGGQIRMYNLLEKLSQRHSIHLFSFIRKPEEAALVRHLPFVKKVTCVYRGKAWQPAYVIRSFVRGYPLVFASYDIGNMRERISHAIQSSAYDLVHIEPGYVWLSLPETRLPVVVSEHNIEHTVYGEYAKRFAFAPLRPILRYDVGKLVRWEKTVWRHAAHITAVSPDDKHYIDTVVDPKKCTVVPNGVNVHHFRYKPKKPQASGEYTFLYVGNFSWMQNRDAASYLVGKIWPVLQARYPKARLHIVGHDAPQTLKRQAQSDSIRFLEHVDDIQKEFHASDILLAPIRIGGGTKYKILEAMACGLPVVTSRVGAKGLNIESGKELVVADDMEDILGGVAKILSDASYRMRLVAGARSKVEKEYSWDSIALGLDRVWKHAYESHR